MSKNFFALLSLVFGYLYNFFEKIHYRFHKNEYVIGSNDWNYKYQLKKELKSESGPFARMIGIFSENNKTDDRVLIFLKHNYPNLSYRLLNSYATLLRIMGEIKSNTKVRIPHFIGITENKNTTILDYEFVHGKQLYHYSEEFQISAFEQCLNYLYSIGKEGNGKIKQLLPIRTAFQILLTFPGYLVVALIKEPKRTIQFLRYTNLFYKNFLYSSLLNAEYVIAHRDLTGENILVSGKDLTIIDLEVMIFAERLTDIALFPRFYYEFISSTHILNVLRKYLKTESDRALFIRLTIYYAIQFIAIESKNRYYDEAVEYLDYLEKNILPSLSLL